MTSLGRAQFVELSDGGRLSYACSPEVGPGDPILLLRPLGGSIALWGAFADRLAIDRRVIAFDPRGVGNSSDPGWLHTTRDMAGDARALLDHLGIARAEVFGLSLGGMVASWLAVDSPNRVAHLILASTLPHLGATSRRLRHRAWPLARALARPHMPVEVALVHQVLSPHFRREHPERVEAIDQALGAHPTRLRNLLALGLAAARHDVHDALRKLVAPTLVLVGALDPVVGEHAEVELLHGIAAARMSVIRGAGHDLTLERPTATAERVLEFLS